jgi:hypothetical protein
MTPPTVESPMQRVEREARESMIPQGDLIESFDAQVWAKEFVKHNLAFHIGLDEGALTAWFASALMRGYDEYRWRTKAYKRSIRRALHPWYSWRRYFTPLDRFGR